MTDLFFSLLQVSLGTRDALPRVPEAHEWTDLLDEAKRQSVVGVLFGGLERLSDQLVVPEDEMVAWYGRMRKIVCQNQKVTSVCKKLCDRLEIDGFDVCVLKGQANHAYYPRELGQRRNCGDIDIWVRPSKDISHPWKPTLHYIIEHWKLTGLCWLHASVMEEGVPIEIHFYPSFMNNPFRNIRFRKYFRSISKIATRKTIEGVEIPAMRSDEDLVFQMNHIYRHLIDEGVGLRQIIDYYFLLQSWHSQHSSSHEEVMSLICNLGMRRFASALMYVLSEVCGLDSQYLLCEPSKKDGSFLLNEIMIAGNFGHDDPRLSLINGHGLKRQIRQAWRRFKRNLRFLSSYPGEVLWEPYARVKHFLWKERTLASMNISL